MDHRYFPTEKFHSIFYYKNLLKYFIIFCLKVIVKMPIKRSSKMHLFTADSPTALTIFDVSKMTKKATCDGIQLD